MIVISCKHTGTCGHGPCLYNKQLLISLYEIVKDQVVIMKNKFLASFTIAIAIVGCDRPQASDIRATEGSNYKDYLTCSFEEAQDPGSEGGIFKRRTNEVSFAAADSPYALDHQLAAPNVHAFGFDIGKVDGSFVVISSYRDKAGSRTKFPSDARAIASAKGTGDEDTFDLSLRTSSGEEIASFQYEAELIKDEELISSSGLGKLEMAGKTYKMNCLYAEEVEL